MADEDQPNTVDLPGSSVVSGSNNDQPNADNNNINNHIIFQLQNPFVGNNNPFTGFPQPPMNFGGLNFGLYQLGFAYQLYL